MWTVARNEYLKKEIKAFVYKWMLLLSHMEELDMSGKIQKQAEHGWNSLLKKDIVKREKYAQEWMQMNDQYDISTLKCFDYEKNE